MYESRQIQQTAAHQLCLCGLRSRATGERGGEEQGEGYGHSEAHDYEFFVSIRNKLVGIITASLAWFCFIRISMEKQQAYWNSRPEIKGCIT